MGVAVVADKIGILFHYDKFNSAMARSINGLVLATCHAVHGTLDIHGHFVFDCGPKSSTRALVS